MPKRKLHLKLLKQKGTTLIEVVIALSLSVILLALLSTLSLVAAAHCKTENDFFLLHQHLSLGMDLIEKEIKRAGFIGCSQVPLSSLELVSEEGALNDENKLKLDWDDKGLLSLEVRHRSLISAPLLRASTPTELEFASSLSVHEGDLMLISDCHYLEIFRVKTLSQGFAGGQRIEPTLALHFSYPKGSQLGFFEIAKTYVADSGRKASDGGKLYALYQKDQQGHASELIEDIQFLSLKPEFQNGSKAFAGMAIMLQAFRSGVFLREYGFVSLRG